MSLSWPPPYEIKTSARAKHINIKLCPENGLQLIVPKKASVKTAIHFLNQKRAWIERHWHLVEACKQPITLPSQINLKAMDATLTLRYEQVSNFKKIKTLQSPSELVLMGPVNNETACCQALTEWVRTQAEIYFPIWLKQISKNIELPFNNLIIRGQKTRWGSCSFEKNISLNFKLLFFSYEVIEYVMMHELCHTRHLNHSKAFWNLVGTHCKTYVESQNELRYLKNVIPSWCL